MKYLMVILALVLLLPGCLDEIELKNQSFDTKAVVIQGKLVLGSPAVAEVSIQRIGDYSGSEVATYIGSAKVSLWNAAGASVELAEVSSRRLYQAIIPSNHPTFKVQTGQAYHIRVTLLDGRQYESEPEVLLPNPELEKMDFQLADLALPDKKGFITTSTYLRFWVNTALKTGNSSEKSKLRWELNAVYRLTDNAKKVCYNIEPQRVEKVFIFDGAAFNLNRLDTFYLADVKLDHRFAEGFYLTILQESLTPAAYSYWNQVKLLAERSGNMFEAPAAKIASNIKSSTDPQEAAYGYFYATTQDTLRRYVNPAQVGSPTNYCPQPPQPRIGPTICDNCLLQTGSSLTKPAFWIE